ncbi:hypothetical protein KIW84_035392 [Lathyrus oleraceus]|uniref:Uncharacterized protein n=1 Tax=Pisum sativum TaxID=3888 RepID=A0A9D4Y3J3_PEA|nr:hypothetical protein KIW84_035392 [Pisum sativum]
MVLSHETPIRKHRTTTLRKGKPSKVSTVTYPSMAASDVRSLEPSTVVKPISMTNLYLDLINVEQNVDASSKSFFVPEVMGNVETSKNTNKPRSATTLSKSSMIVVERDNNDENIRVLISQVLGIEPKIEEKDDSDGMYDDLSDKEENSSEKKDRSTDIVNVDNLDSDDEPIGKRLAPEIMKRLKSRKGKAVESSSKPSKSLKRSTSVGTTKWWSKVVTPITKKRTLKRNEVLSDSNESDCDVEHDV